MNSLECNRIVISKKALFGEQECVEHLLPLALPFKECRDVIYSRAKEYVEAIRADSDGISIEAFIHEYSLDSREGVMIMCLAEALLRIPDKATVDALIKDKLQSPEWESHLDKTQPLFLNAATWGLMLTGKVLALDDMPDGISGTLGHLVNTMGEPIIRTSIKQAMKFLGTQFVIGENIKNALKKAADLQSQGYLFSYDMLGEAACTQEQADKFYQAYMDSITSVGQYTQHDKPLHTQSGISIKLSALHPRYEFLQKDRIMAELLPRLISLFKHAKENHLPVTIDAEESSRLDLSLELFHELITSPDLKGFYGVGFVVQAYMKRASFVTDYIVKLAKQHNRYIPIRLVKGAYWDSEIKWAQELGLEGYPVFTRKSHTDLSYFACANIMLNNIDHIYPQFATHNALTVAGILEVAKLKNITDSKFEFQRLYGMGDVFYNQMVEKRSVRIYAPVGKYNELLPYLIRRLLENGANTSFVNTIVDENAPLSDLLRNPVNRAKQNEGKPNESIPLPCDIYHDRKNSLGFDLGNRYDVEKLRLDLQQDNPVEYAKTVDVDTAIDCAVKHFSSWNHTPVMVRCSVINKVADLFVEHRIAAINLLIHEAGKTISDAISEVREAEDFCRYYALIAMNERTLQGATGESNILTYEGKGVFACISPWNFPLAIFTGQVVAALVSGNTVIAKPATQTPLIAKFAVTLMHKAGIPINVLQLVIGSGATVGEALIHNKNIAGIAFTGSTEVAQHINAALAQRNCPIASFVAETGGQNCMIVDSSALLEQAVSDIIHSSFDSAGQRCSSLRILYIQEDIAEKLIHLLSGAIAELKIGNPEHFDTDIGSVIDASAKKSLQKHIDKMKSCSKFIASAKIYSPPLEGGARGGVGNFIAPHVFEIENTDILDGEVFGPILHIIRYSSDKLHEVVDEINSLGYGLTCGIHSRIDERIDYVKQNVRAGNIYVNRSMTGAVVGVQPFGGMGLSGTGPKAGGPHYLQAFSTEKTITVNTAAIGGNVGLYQSQE